MVSVSRQAVDENGKLLCSVCNQYKYNFEFTYRTSQIRGFGSQCKECAKKRQKNSFRQKRYGINTDDYEAMLDAQFFECLICHTDIEQCTRELDVDHCHHCNQVRGLLCGSCNQGLGSFKDNLENILAAAEYLRSHSCEPV
jgi:hypothetical protein